MYRLLDLEKAPTPTSQPQYVRMYMKEHKRHGLEPKVRFANVGVCVYGYTLD